MSEAKGWTTSDVPMTMSASHSGISVIAASLPIPDTALSARRTAAAGLKSKQLAQSISLPDHRPHQNRSGSDSPKNTMSGLTSPPHAVQMQGLPSPRITASRTKAVVNSSLQAMQCAPANRCEP